MKEILKNKGYKATPARLAILNIFKENKIPLNAEIIHEKLKKTSIFRNTNEATIYRTLSSFEEAGILKKLDLKKESAYFELQTEHHHHIVCLKCNTIEDFKITKLENVLRRVVEHSSKFKSLKEHSLELFGLCKKCI